MCESREKQLAVRSDQITMSGKSAVVLAGGPLNNFTLRPTTFGDRIVTVANIFARWRIVKLIVQLPPAGTGGSAIAFGITDDFIGEGGSSPAPSTFNEVLELRCSRTNLSTVNPSEIEWKPLDSSKWYYTQPGASGDNRLVFPGSLSTFGPGTGVPIVFYYTLEFAGAFDNVS
jgi:hypothetical protein